jgi:MFS family permease
MSQQLSPEMVTPAVQRRLTSVLFISGSIFSAAQIATFALLPIVSVRLGGSDAMAGIPATLGQVGHALAAYPVGWIMDRYGRRAGLCLGLLVAMSGALLNGFAINTNSFLILCFGAALFGVGRATSEQARFAAAEIQVPERRAKAIGTIVFAGTIGAVVGPLLITPSGNFVARYGFDAQIGPFAVGAIFTYAAFLMLFFFLRPDPMRIGQAISSQASEGEDASLHTARPLRSIFSAWSVRIAVLSMVIGQLVMTMLMVITPVHMNHIAMTTQDLGWVFMAHTLGMFGLSAFTGRLIDRVGRTTMIMAGCVTLIVAALLAPVAGSVWLLATALFLLGLGWNFCFIAGSSMLSSALRSIERGRVQGANETMVAVAAGFGSFSTGMIYAGGGLATLSLIGIGLASILMLATIWFVLYQRARDRSADASTVASS